MAVDRKQELIQHSVDLICTVGYDSFSFADLAQRTGIAKASIHHHFANKADLALAVVDFLGGLVQDIHQKIKALEAPERIPFVLQALRLDFFDSKICPLSSLQAELNVLPAQLHEPLQRLTLLEHQLVADLIGETAHTMGVALPVSADQMAYHVLCTLKGGFQYHRTLRHTNVSDFDSAPDVLLQEVFRLHGFAVC
ncbi:MAG: TetR/AcrR family transcriptional regulator [Formosimonas sp.]